MNALFNFLFNFYFKIQNKIFFFGIGGIVQVIQISTENN